MRRRGNFHLVARHADATRRSSAEGRGGGRRGRLPGTAKNSHSLSDQKWGIGHRKHARQGSVCCVCATDDTANQLSDGKLFTSFLSSACRLQRWRDEISRRTARARASRQCGAALWDLAIKTLANLAHVICLGMAWTYDIKLAYCTYT